MRSFVSSLRGQVLSRYPPAFQLALDMLKRLATANEEIVDVLVGKDQLLLALRFLRSLGPEAVATVSPRRFLEAAYNTGDSSLFYIGMLEPYPP